MALNLIDTHAHLDFSEFSEDQSEVIRRAAAAGVTKIVNAGCDAGHLSRHWNWPLPMTACLRLSGTIRMKRWG
jgi:Tat protein secretion system quality control protein TatD with DNase activity